MKDKHGDAVEVTLSKRDVKVERIQFSSYRCHVMLYIDNFPCAYLAGPY